MVRLADIANRANVSLSTVSAVLNGKECSIRVSDKTAQKVRKIAVELNYIPNVSAKLLSGQASHALGVLVDSEDAAVRFQQLEYIDREAERNGYRLLIAEAHNNMDKQLTNYRTLLQYGVDGVICHANSLHEKLLSEKNIVFFGAAPIPQTASVYYDIESGYREAIRQFEKEGRQKIAALFSSHGYHDSMLAREQAYHNLEEHFTGGFCPLDDDNLNRVREEANRVVDEWIIPHHIDGLIVQNDFWALALLFALNQRGLKVPKDISLVGQDNSSFCACTNPTISTIDPNLALLGKSVIELMIKTLKSSGKITEAVNVPTTLIKRESTLKYIGG